MASATTEFVTYRRDDQTYELIAAGVDAHGRITDPPGTGPWTAVRDLTPERGYHLIETAETTPALLRAYIATNHMTVTALHDAQYRPVTAGWTASGKETWVEVTVDNNGGTPFTTWVRTDTRGWLTAIARPA